MTQAHISPYVFELMKTFVQNEKKLGASYNSIKLALRNMSRDALKEFEK